MAFQIFEAALFSKNLQNGNESSMGYLKAT